MFQKDMPRSCDGNKTDAHKYSLCHHQYRPGTLPDNADLMKDFLERLLKDESEHKVYVICDNLNVHHSKPVKAWLEEQKDRISMFHLPSYAPEYNPDEYLNSDLKTSVASKPQAKNLDDLQTATEEFMAFLSDKPKHVAAYFEHEKVAEYHDAGVGDAATE